MDTELFRQVLEYLKTTGEFMAKAGFEITVRQVYANAITALIGGLFAFIFLFVVFFSWKNILKTVDFSSTTGQQDSMYIVWGIISALGSVISILHLLLSFPIAIKMLINPYWYAIEMIIKLVNG